MWRGKEEEETEESEEEEEEEEESEEKWCNEYLGMGESLGKYGKEEASRKLDIQGLAIWIGVFFENKLG